MHALLFLLASLSFAASPQAPDASLTISTAPLQSDVQAGARPEIKPPSKEALEKINGIKSRLENLTQGSLDQKSGKLDVMYQGGKNLPASITTTGKAGGAASRVMLDPGVPVPPEKPKHEGVPTALQSDLFRSLDKYKETRGVSKFLKDKDVRIDMTVTPGAAAVYDDDINSIILSEDFRTGGAESALATFYHEAGHAQWHEMGLNGNVIENEFRSWTIESRLNYEMFKDPEYKKMFKVAVRAFEGPLAAAEARQAKVDYAFQAARAAKGMVMLTMWPKAYWNEVKEWWAGSEAEQLRNVMRERPELLTGYVKNVDTYKDFCKGQKEFLAGVKKAYDKHVGWQLTIPDRRAKLEKELVESKTVSKLPGYRVKGKGRYVLQAKSRTVMRFNLKTGDKVQVTEEDNGKVGVAEFGKYQKLFLEIARTPEKIAKGLKYRNELGFNGGMLFDYGSDSPREFSTEGVWELSDVIFLDENFTVTNVYANMAADEKKARPEKLVREEMALLDKTETYWRQWEADDLKWRQEHPDYCTHPDIKEVLDWTERFNKVMKQ